MKKIIIKSIIYSSFFLLLTAFSTPLEPTESSITEAPEDYCTISNTAFKGGEELVYKVYYNWNFVWLSAGEIKFKVKDLGNKYLMSCVGTTYKSYEWFFKVQDIYTVVVDKKTLLPISSVRNVSEGKYRMYDKMLWNQRDFQIKSHRGKTKDKTVIREFNVEKCMHDILSAIYYARNLNYDGMEKGQQFPIDIFMDKEIFNLKSTYHGKEIKKIKGKGKFKTVRVEPKLVIGDVFKESNMQMWATDDKNRIPLQIETPLSVGSAQVILKSYKGLRYDLNSKIK